MGIPYSNKKKIVNQRNSVSSAKYGNKLNQFHYERYVINSKGTACQLIKHN